MSHHAAAGGTRETRRSKRLHDEVGSEGEEGSDSSSRHASKQTKTAVNNQRRAALADVTTQHVNAPNTHANAHGKNAGVTKKATKQQQPIVEQVVEEEKEEQPKKVQTRAHARAPAAAAAAIPAAAEKTKQSRRTRSKAQVHTEEAADGADEDEVMAHSEEERDKENDDANVQPSVPAVKTRAQEKTAAAPVAAAAAAVAPAPVASKPSTAAIISAAKARIIGLIAGSAASAGTTSALVHPPPHILHPHDAPSWQLSLSDACQEYADSIYQHLRTTEVQNAADAHYLENLQGDLTASMRAILVDWLVEVAEEYTLAPQTLFLAVGFIDRFLSQQQIDRGKLQLVGITAMLLAAKYWEIYPPQINDFVFISDSTYTRAQVLAMENHILIALRFKLTTPTSWEFSRRFLRAANADKKTEHLVDYLLELALTETQMLKFRPSIVAASALFLALYTQHIQPWSEQLEQHSGLRVEELKECVTLLQHFHDQAYYDRNNLHAVKDKYSDAGRFMAVATNIVPRALE